VARIPPEDELVEGYAIVLFEEAETMELSRRSRKGKGREDGEMEEEEEEDGFDPSALIIVVVCVGVLRSLSQIQAFARNLAQVG